MSTDKKHKYIIIDDHPFLRDGIINFINADGRFEFAGEFSDIRSVLNSNAAGRPDVMILDLNLNETDSRKSFPALKNKFPGCKIVAYTQYEGLDKDLEKIGFDGYVEKSEKDLLLVALISVINGNKYFKNNDKSIYKKSVLPEGIDNFLKVNQLTKRESEVAKYMLLDFSNKEIADKIFISEATVETHRKHIKEKLKAKNKRELFAILRSFDLG